MRTIKLAAFALLVATATLSFADTEVQPLLSKVQMQVSDQQWVNTKTANVVINVSAALQSSDLSELQNKVTNDLKSLYDTSWHITGYDRAQDASGLERATLQAEARLPESQIVELRDKVKALSKPGEKFTILTIDYSPSFAELNEAHSQLRVKLYEQAISELAVLNKLYAPHQYTLYEFTMFNRPMPMMRKTINTMANVMMDSSKSAPSMEVSQQLEATANVVFASYFDSTQD